VGGGVEREQVFFDWRERGSYLERTALETLSPPKKNRKGEKTSDYFNPFFLFGESHISKNSEHENHS